MKKLLLPIFIFSSIVFAQPGSSAVPFLIISTSVDANGMGGIMTVANSSSPSSMMFNPAQLGVSSQTNFLSAEAFTHKTAWLPTFGLKDLWINNYSIMYGMKLPDGDNSNISVGFGYSRLYFNLGTFVVTSEIDPTPIATFSGYEASDNFSLGVGIDLGFRLAFGTTIKKITSSLSPIGTAEEIGTGTANILATDIGLLAKFPVADYILKNDEGAKKGLSPFFDITAAYVLNNLGGNVIYKNSPFSDPLPRTARVGWSSEAGIRFQTEKLEVSLIHLTVARESENFLLKRYNDGSWEYSGAPFGNIDLYENVLAGRHRGYVNIRRGFSVELLESITIRQGSYDGDGNLSYSTSGYSVSTRGISKVIGLGKIETTDFNIVQYILSHLEIRFSHSEYTGHPILGGTNFDNMIFSFRH